MSKYSPTNELLEAAAEELKRLYRRWDKTEDLEYEKQWGKLYDNAESLLHESFLAEWLVDKPKAPLRALQGALQGAIAQDNAAKMAKYTLAHARWRAALTAVIENHSPLDALHAGNLQRAREQVALYDIKQQIFWYLLLSWELKDQGKLRDVKKTLELLLEQPELPRLGMHEAERAADLLVHVFEINDEQVSFRSLRLALLDDDGNAALCQHLINKEGGDDEASAVADNIRMRSQKAEILMAIAGEQIRRKKQSIAQGSLQEALEAAVGSDRGSWQEVKRRCGIAVLQAQAHDDACATLTAALETAGQIQEEEHHQRIALREIAVAWAQVGEFDAAFQTVQKIKGSRWLQREEEEALAGIAIAQAEAGKVDDALKTLQDIHRTADEFLRVLQTIITMQTKNGDLDAAIGTFDWGMEGLGPEKRGENRILAAIVTTLAEASDIPNARRITAQINHPAWKAEALLAIAKAQAKAGDPSAARETFATAIATVQDLPEENKIAYLREITIAQAQVNEFAAANTTCAPILEDAQKISEEELEWFTNTAVQLAKAGASDIGQAILAACVPTAQRIRNRDDRVQALWKIGMAQIQAGAPDVGRRTLAATLLDNPIKEKNWSRQLRLMDAVKAQVLAGELDTAYAYWYTARQQKYGHDSGWQRWALGAITEAQAKAASQIEGQECPSGDNLQKIWALRKISMAQAIEGDHGAAQTTLERAQQAVPGLRLEWEQAEALMIIGTTQAQIWGLGAAIQTLADAMKVAKQITNPKDQSRTLWILAMVVVHLRTRAGYLQAGQSIGSEAQRDQIRGWLAQAQAQIGDLDAALKTLGGIHTRIPTNATMLSMTQYYEERALEQIAIELAQRGDVRFALQIEKALEGGSFKALVRAAIATKQEQDGQDREAQRIFLVVDQTVNNITSEDERSRIRRRIADIQLKAGLNARAVDIALVIETDQDIYLPEVATALVKAKDTAHFKKLLPSCANNLDAAYRMCVLLAQLYPEQATAIAEEVKRNSKTQLARRSSSKLFAMDILLSKYNNDFAELPADFTANM